MRVIWEELDDFRTMSSIPVSAHLSSVSYFNVPLVTCTVGEGRVRRQEKRIKICKFVLAGEAPGQKYVKHNTSLFSPKHVGRQVGRGTGHRAGHRERLGPQHTHCNPKDSTSLRLSSFPCRIGCRAGSLGAPEMPCLAGTVSNGSCRYGKPCHLRHPLPLCT